MKLSNANKALIITILLASSIVLMAFSFHIKKKNELVAETYYEFLEEDDFFEEKEDLAEILESFDNLKTNKAFNETKSYEDYEDDDFKETMERLKNRNANDEAYEAKSFEPSDNLSEDSEFSEINDIIEKRTNTKTANKNSTISYSLVGRDLLNNPTPIYLCENGGKIVVSIKVAPDGKVIDAQYNNASTSENGCLIDHALEYAKSARFSSDASKASQLGSISFVFKGKQ